MDTVPTFDALMNPLLDALRGLGGSGSVSEIEEAVVENLGLSDEVASRLHNPDKSSQTQVGYRLAWARTYLKKFGLLENSARGIWAMTPRANSMSAVNPQEVVSWVRALDTTSRSIPDPSATSHIDSNDYDVQGNDWSEQLHKILTKKVSPDGFERLTQRVLRESGFIHVEVTGRTGDGGIDGKGIARLHGFMSFHIIFQCKRYQGSVSAGAIRDFRGAMVGRADKGLFITTGTFTKAAVQEATRDGAPPIDLVDGMQFVEKLKEFGLGVKTEMIEQVTVDAGWFEDL